jgi:parallel beta helix pectate lyase-like protein/fibronectin type III domain protein
VAKKTMTLWLVGLLAGLAYGDTYTVDDDGPADFGSIQDAINFSWDGDVIEVQPGTYNESIYFDNRAIILTSTDPDDPNVVADTIIDSPTYPGVLFDFNEGPNTIIIGFTVTGYGIECLGTSPTITKNIIRDCSGRGISGSSNAAPTITNNIIDNNKGGISGCDGPIELNEIINNAADRYGGGLYVCNGIINNNIISNNIATYLHGECKGGGLYDCDGTIISNIITGNAAITVSEESDAVGGGLHDCDGDIIDNTICNNIASASWYAMGGGLSNCDGTISSNNITSNSATGFIEALGGGLCLCDATIEDNTITNNEITVTGNGRTARGGGLYGCGNTINNNIINGNKAKPTGVSGSACGGGLDNCDGPILNNQIRYNELLEGSGGGLSSCGGTIKNNDIIGNEISSATSNSRGGGLSSCSNAIIIDNTIMLNIVNGYTTVSGGGLCYCQNSIIENNIIVANAVTSINSNSFGGGLDNCDLIYNNIIAGNASTSTKGISYGGGISRCNDEIINNTIIGNRSIAIDSPESAYGGGLYDCSTTTNNIIAFNSAEDGGGIYGSCQNTFNAFWSNGKTFGNGSYGGIGDIHENPLFVIEGYWDPNDTPDIYTDDTWIDGDYHLLSTEGRWDPNSQVWVIDDANSPCIDAGDPADDFGDETQPHGNRINMGAYGGTVEASKTPGAQITNPGIPRNLSIKGGHKQLTISWDDPNDTGGLDISAFKVYRGPDEYTLAFYTQVASNEFGYADTNIQNGSTYFYAVSAVNDFGEGELTLPVSDLANWNDMDFNGDGAIDIVDYAFFSKEWLWEATWHKP